MISPLRPTRHGGRHVMGLAVNRFLGAVSAVVFAKSAAQLLIQPKEGDSPRTQDDTQDDTGVNWGLGPAQHWASES